MPIDRIEAWTVDEPLTHPVEFGNMRFTSRDYTVVRVIDDGRRRGHRLRPRARGAGRSRRGVDRRRGHRSRAGDVDRDLGRPLRADDHERSARRRAARDQPHRHRPVGPARQACRRPGPRPARAPVRHASPRTSAAATTASDGPPRTWLPSCAATSRRGSTSSRSRPAGLAPREEEAWVAAAREAIGPDVDLAIDTHWTWSDVRSARRVLERLDDLRSRLGRGPAVAGGPRGGRRAPPPRPYARSRSVTSSRAGGRTSRCSSPGRPTSGGSTSRPSAASRRRGASSGSRRAFGVPDLAAHLRRAPRPPRRQRRRGDLGRVRHAGVRRSTSATASSVRR